MSDQASPDCLVTQLTNRVKLKSLLKRTLVTLASISVFTYCAAMAYLYLRQEALLFFPDPENAADAAVFSEFDTTFSVDGQTLDGWYIPGESGLTVVYYGGNAEELSRRIDNIILFGPHNYLLINYRGFGDSTGSPGEQSMKTDALAILDMARIRYGFDYADTVIIGRSLGTGVATHVAASLPVRGLVLITPYDSIRAVAQGRYPIFPVGLLLRHHFDSMPYLEAITAPALIIKAETDRVVPHVHTDNLVAGWQGPLTFTTLPGSHGSVVNSDIFTQRISTFISQLPE